MIVIDVKQFYKYDTISKINSKPWNILSELLMEDEDYLFDFKGIEVIDPWLNDEFNKLMRDDRVNIRLYSSLKTACTINTMCVLGNMKPNRATSIESEAPKSLTPFEKMTQRLANELQSYIEVDENNKVAVLKVHKRFSQVDSVNTVDYIEADIKQFRDTHEDYKLVVELGKITLQKNIIKLLSVKLDEMLKKGIDVEITSSEKEVMDRFSTHYYLNNNKKYRLDEKIKLFKNIKVGTVGMLTKYKSSRTRDEFGRQGEGEVVSCRVAVFMGLNNKGYNSDSNEETLSFMVFNVDKFYTYSHWNIESGGESIEEPEATFINPKVSQVGLYGEFLGTTYHLLEPIQYNRSDYTNMYTTDESGKIVEKKYTIPERISAVLNDWEDYIKELVKQNLNITNFEYNKSDLEECIKQNIQLLSDDN